MTSFTLHGKTFSTVGTLPAVGAKAPAFSVVKSDLSTLSSADLRGKKIVLNIFPSIDTPTCATSVRSFNKRAAETGGATVVCVSLDLPFALGRFCAAEGITNVVATSSFRSTFGADYGVTISDGPLMGLLARAVVVIDAGGIVRHQELVGDIANEPDYAKALAACR